MNRFVQFCYGAMGLAFVGTGIVLLVQLGFPALVLTLPLSLAGIYCYRWAISSRLTLTETEISVRYALGEKSAQLSEIESWRTEPGSKSAPHWKLQLRNNRGSLSISQYFAVDDAFSDCLSKLRNLNDLEISIAP
ncbi:MAG: hypothetical protein WAM66_00035 [Acidobacteriaceae bacterium]